MPPVWGLYNKDSKTAIPLKSLDISVKIIHNIARVFYSQNYYNDSDSLIETEFFFPISPDACFDSFEATFNNTTIKGIVKKKEEAKEEYKQAVEQGHTAAYSEINEETSDIMKVLIGNIPQKTNISITYSYLQKLDIALNKFWCFRLFSTFTPRYNGNLSQALDYDLSILAHYPTVSKNSPNAYPWNIQVEIQSPSPIKLLKSPSHDIVTSYGNENHTCTISFDPQTKYVPNKDFVLLYSNGKENNVDYLLTPFEDGYCAMVSLMADFNNVSDQETYESFAKAKQVGKLHDMNTIKGEYIFLIDRSGSMYGDRIKMATESLTLFIKSLPKDSLFNVVSFGSTFTMLNKSSLSYSNDSVASSINKINGFSADMGGTEIYGALKNVLNAPEKKGYPRFVFLLTDGGVSNTQEVLNLIKDNAQKARVFTIGIGNGCSSQLITKGAELGRGKFEFVTQNAEIYEKVINLLNASLSLCYYDLSLQGNNFDALVKSVSPNPATLSCLINGETITFFLLLRNEVFKDNSKWALQLRLYDSNIKEYRTVKVDIDVSEALENEFIPKLAVHDMIKRLESQKDYASESDSEIAWICKEDLKQTMVEYSLKYGILCKETAFFCKISDDNQIDQLLPACKVVIPTLRSQDHDIDAQLSSIQSIMAQNLCSVLNRSESLDLCMQKSCDLSASSVHFYRKASKPSAFSWLGGVKDSVSNAFSSLFSRRNRSSMMPELVPQTDILDDALESSVQSSQTKSTRPYLNVIMGQQFEGNWDPANETVKEKVFKGGKMPAVPSEVKINKASLIDTIWLTILVLVWLEVVCKDDQKAWTLVHQKGCEWLKTQGVNYEQVKEFGKSALGV